MAQDCEKMPPSFEPDLTDAVHVLKYCVENLTDVNELMHPPTYIKTLVNAPAFFRPESNTINNFTNTHSQIVRKEYGWLWMRCKLFYKLWKVSGCRTNCELVCIQTSYCESAGVCLLQWRWVYRRVFRHRRSGMLIQEKEWFAQLHSSVAWEYRWSGSDTVYVFSIVVLECLIVIIHFFHIYSIAPVLRSYYYEQNCMVNAMRTCPDPKSTPAIFVDNIFKIILYGKETSSESSEDCYYDV